MVENQTVPLFWWSERKFIGRTAENYGDLLSKYIVEKISGKRVKWVHPKKQNFFTIKQRNYLAVGSILHHATRKSIVWGSGIIDREHHIAKADFRAVRGPKTREYLLKLNYECPEVYGDPALLLPHYFTPGMEKNYRLGIIPHYHDYEWAKNTFGKEDGILVVDLLNNDVEFITKRILECESIISSSLHGLIVSHTYGIPALWVKFSNKPFGDDIKYIDYLESLKMEAYKPTYLNDKPSMEELFALMNDFPLSPSKDVLSKIQDELISNHPF